MRQGTIVKTPPTGLALSLVQAKRQLRIEAADTSEDEHLTELCKAAGRFVERVLGYPVLRTVMETHLSCFPDRGVWLGGGDAPQILSLQYRPTIGGPLVTMAEADYILDAASRPAAVYPAAACWPATYGRPSSVVIEWRAGWADAASIPDDVIHAMKLLVGHWDANREAVVVGSISTEVSTALHDILAPLRIPFVG